MKRPMKFLIGDAVRVKEYEPRWQTQSPGWNIYMEEFCGKNVIIEDISSRGFLIFHGWAWRSEWLEPLLEDDLFEI